MTYFPTNHFIIKHEDTRFVQSPNIHLLINYEYNIKHGIWYRLQIQLI